VVRNLAYIEWRRCILADFFLGRHDRQCLLDGIEQR
jgi:hypothetical protein